MNISDFLDDDEKKSQKPNQNKQHGNVQYINLTHKSMVGNTFIYKPLVDENGAAWRKINFPFELHLKVVDEQGKTRWKVLGALERMEEYGQLTDAEVEVYKKAMNLMYSIRDMQDPDAWATSKKLNTVFYAYALAVIDNTGKNVLANKGFAIVNHTSKNFIDTFHKVRQTKTAVWGSGSWINDYYNNDKPGYNLIVKTTKGNIGFDVTVDFMERKPDVTPEELKKAQELCTNLDEVGVRAKFDMQYFNEIITTCNKWLEVKANTVTTSPVESDLDKVKTEIENGKGDTGTPVTPMGQTDGDVPPPNADLQMKG